MNEKIFRAACFVVAVVAGTAGVVMLMAPTDTNDYFSWPIGPPPLAATVGGFYLASAVTFAVLGWRNTWVEARAICVGILAFTLPTLVATVNHRDLFDWDRAQAIAWVVLFTGSPITFASFLYLRRGEVTAQGDRIRLAARAALGLLGAVYAALAIALLADPTSLEDRSPFLLPGLSGRFVGSWCAFLAVIALFSLVRNRWNEAVIAIGALVLWPVGALAAALRSFDDLAPSGRRAAYLVVVVVLGAIAAAALVAGRDRVSASDLSR